MGQILILFTLFMGFFTGNPYTSIVPYSSSIVSTSNKNLLTGSGTQVGQLFWSSTGTISTCSVEVDSSSDGVTWTAGGAIGAQTCTSPGSSSQVSVTANYIRIDIAVLTGGGTLTAVFYGASSGSGGGSTSITSSTGDITVSPSPLTGTGTVDLNLGATNIWTGNHTFSFTGVASTPSLLVSGTPFAGTDANSFGSLSVIWGSPSAGTALSTAGTGLWINAPSGFTGNLAQFSLNGVANFTFADGGTFTAASTIQTVGSIRTTSSGTCFAINNTSVFFGSPSGGIASFGSTCGGENYTVADKANQFTEATNSATGTAGTGTLYEDSTSHELEAATNGTTNVGILQRTQPGAIALTGQTAAIATATLCAAAAGACNVAGTYRVNFYLADALVCATPGSAAVIVKLTWTDAVGTKSAQVVPLDVNGGTSLLGSMALGTTTNNATAEVTITTTGTIIQYATAYTGCTSGTGTYDINAQVTRMN